MSKKVVSVVLVLTLLLSLISTSMFAAEVQVDNTGFEDGLSGWNRNYGSGGDVETTNTKSYSGDYSLKLTDNSSSAQWGVSSDARTAYPNTEYVASAKVFIEGSNADAYMYLRFYDSSGNQLASHLTSISGPDNQWTTISNSEISPANTDSVKILLYTSVSGTGNVYFDEASITYEPDMLFNNYSFEDGLTDWTRNWGSGGDVAASTTRSYTGSYSLKITDTSSSTNWGAASQAIPAISGIKHKAMARVYLESGASANMYLRYYNSSGSQLDSTLETISSPTNQWTEISVSDTAPSGTATVKVLVYSSVSDTGTVYFDDVLITKEFTSLGSPVSFVGIHGAAFGEDASGNDMAFTVTSAGGDLPSYLNMIDVNTMEVVKRLGVGAGGVWAITVSSDNVVYFGSSQNGHLYKYVPGENTVTDLGVAVSGESIVWTLTADDNGNVYGGTYDDCYLFQYNPSTDTITTMGPNGSGYPLDSSKDYLRSVAYDNSNDVVYGGTGTTSAGLIRYEMGSGQTDEILPQAYMSENTTYDLNVEGGKVFARLSPSSTLLVLDVTEDQNNNVSATVDKVINDVQSRKVSPLYNGKVYYTSDRVLHSYDLTSKTTASLGVNLSFSPMRMKIVQLDDQTNFPGDTLIGMSNMDGLVKLVKYNFSTQNLQVEAADEIPGTPKTIRTIAKGPDGNIYTSATQLGNYTPMRSDLTTKLPGSGAQAYGMGTVGDKLYLGYYPGAIIFEYDPDQIWGTQNPEELFELKFWNNYEQDRIWSMIEGDGKLLIGSSADYGKLPGALTIYDPATGNDPDVYKNIVNDQSVLSLAYLNGKIYGGTGIWGGFGATPTQSTGKLFEFDMSTGQKVREITPVSGKKAVTALMVGPSNKIWGVAEGYLFIYNPSTNSVEYTGQLHSTTYNSNVYRDASLELGKDGYVYCTSGGKMFRINPSTQSVTTILSSGAYLLEQDDFGNLYYKSGTELFRYAY